MTEVVPAEELWTGDTTLVLCAIRYTIGRRSYVVPEGWEWAVVSQFEMTRRGLFDVVAHRS